MDYSMISVTADARTILANSVETQDSVWTASAPGIRRTEPERIALPAGSYNDPVWAADGRIVYAAQSNLWLTSANGLDRKPLFGERVNASEPAVSADGRTVVFVLRRQGSMNLWRSNLDGSGLRQVTTGERDRHPALSPDGKWVAYAAVVQGQWGIWKMPLDGVGPPVELVDSYAGFPAISPDSRFLALCDPAGKIQVRSFDDGSHLKEMPAPADASDLHWSANGKALFYVSQLGSFKQFWSQPVAGGPPVRIGGPLKTDVTDVSWSNDGRRIVYLHRELKVDLSLITNFR
jgi:Tol biopolymer transport system component